MLRLCNELLLAIRRPPARVRARRARCVSYGSDSAPLSGRWEVKDAWSDTAMGTRRPLVAHLLEQLARACTSQASSARHTWCLCHAAAMHQTQTTLVYALSSERNTPLPQAGTAVLIALSDARRALALRTTAERAHRAQQPQLQVGAFQDGCALRYTRRKRTHAHAMRVAWHACAATCSHRHAVGAACSSLL
jgi:hypothetical protein